ncbi:hypothetical protein BH24ACT5_BH24ACT5_08770 [soil metagenome]
MADDVTFDDPQTLAAHVATCARPLLVGFDVDGVLSPLVAHAADAALVPGVLDSLIALAAATPVGVVSGRSIDGLTRFGFPTDLMMAGSHGAEWRGRPFRPLDAAEIHRMKRIRDTADYAARAAGPGAWVESKPTALVVHVKEADPARASAAFARMERDARSIPGTHIQHGHNVLEISVREASKADAVMAMAAEVTAATTVFVGDDLTDENVFAALAPTDIGIRVGTGFTSVRHRLRDPLAVRRFVAALATTVG